MRFFRARVSEKTQFPLCGISWGYFARLRLGLLLKTPLRGAQVKTTKSYASFTFFQPRSFWRLSRRHRARRPSRRRTLLLPLPSPPPPTTTPTPPGPIPLILRSNSVRSGGRENESYLIFHNSYHQQRFRSAGACNPTNRRLNSLCSAAGPPTRTMVKLRSPRGNNVTRR